MGVGPGKACGDARTPTRADDAGGSDAGVLPAPPSAPDPTGTGRGT